MRQVLTIYAPVIYTALCIMFWMGAYTLRGEVGGGWALEFLSFLDPVKWERADRRVPFHNYTGERKPIPRSPVGMGGWCFLLLEKMLNPAGVNIPHPK